MHECRRYFLDSESSNIHILDAKICHRTYKVYIKPKIFESGTLAGSYKQQREKGLLNWERTAGEGDKGGSSSILHMFFFHSSPRVLENIPIGGKRGRQQNRQKKGSESRRGQGEGTSATGADQNEERTAEGGQGHPQQQSTVVSAVSHIEN